MLTVLGKHADIILEKKKEVRKSKKYFWVCDLGMNKKKMTQTRLSFPKITPGGSRLTDRASEGERFRDFSENTFTAGQLPDSVRGDRTATETGNDVMNN